MRKSSAALLHADDQIWESSATRHRDYILTGYDAPAPTGPRLHSSSVLRHALRSAGLLDTLWPALSRVRETLGPDETVWGLKMCAETPAALELYFYKRGHDATDSLKSVSHLARSLRGLIHVRSRVGEELRYFMCSVEFGARHIEERAPAYFHVYTEAGKQSREPCSCDGHSYLVAGTRLRLENHYRFYRPELNWAEVQSCLRNSPRSGNASSQTALLPPVSRSAYTICYAMKPLVDAIYLSRLTTDDAAAFMSERCPSPIADALTRHRVAFSHLRWDIGYDFDLPFGSTEATIKKIGFYGII